MAGPLKSRHMPKILEGKIRTDANALPFLRSSFGESAAFFTRYGRSHVYTYAASKRVLRPGIWPLKEQERASWESRTDPLWSCFVSTNVGTGQARGRRTVKSWLARRMRIAFAAGLAKHGYAVDGTRMGNIQAAPEHLDTTVEAKARTRTDNLVGTVIFMARENMLKMSPADVQLQMDGTIERIITKATGVARDKSPGSGNKVRMVKSTLLQEEGKEKPFQA